MTVRTEKENYRLNEYIESAIGNVEEAISSISYSTYPEVNKDAIAKLNSVIGILEDVLGMDIFKP